jgi:hypothetical protein
MAGVEEAILLLGEILRAAAGADDDADACAIRRATWSERIEPASATASATLAAAKGTARETCGRSLISTYFLSSNSSGTWPAT